MLSNVAGGLAQQMMQRFTFFADAAKDPNIVTATANLDDALEGRGVDGGNRARIRAEDRAKDAAKR